MTFVLVPPGRHPAEFTLALLLILAALYIIVLARRYSRLNERYTDLSVRYAKALVEGTVQLAKKNAEIATLKETCGVPQPEAEQEAGE